MRLSLFTSLLTVVLACGCPGGGADARDEELPPVGTFALDGAGAVTVDIDADGGVVAGSTATLQIPADALTSSTSIALTPVTGFALAGFVSGVDFAPAGTRFDKAAVVRMAAADWVVGYDREGADTHLIPHRKDGDEIEFPIWHFSGAVAGDGPLPETAPRTPEQRALDAAVRGEVGQVEQALREAFVDVDKLVARAGDSRADLEAALPAAAEFEGLVVTVGADAAFAVQLESVTTRLTAAFVAERDRLIERALDARDWLILLDVENFVYARANVYALGNEGVLTAPALSAALPLAVSLHDVGIAFDEGSQRYIVGGRAQMTLGGATVFTAPGFTIDFNTRGAAEGSPQLRSADDGTFAQTLTPTRQTVGASLVAQFAGFEVLSFTASADVSTDNTAPLAIEVVIDPGTFDADDGSNIVVQVKRGAGAFGLSGQVSLRLTTASGTCSLGATGGVPDVDGLVASTLGCDAAASGTVIATVTHRDDTVSAQASFTATDGEPPPEAAVWQGPVTMVFNKNLTFGVPNNSDGHRDEHLEVQAEVRCVENGEGQPPGAQCENLSVTNLSYVLDDNTDFLQFCGGGTTGSCTSDPEVCAGHEICAPHGFFSSLSSCTSCLGLRLHSEGISAEVNFPDFGSGGVTLQVVPGEGGGLVVSHDVVAFSAVVQEHIIDGVCELQGPSCDGLDVPPESVIIRDSFNAVRLPIGAFGAVASTTIPALPASGPLSGTLTSETLTVTYDLARQN